MVIDKNKYNEAYILEVLQQVKDPEIPVLSLIDLGVIRKVELNNPSQSIKITMTPTFAGCPALEHMKNEIIEVLNADGFEKVEVEINFEDQWNTNMISEKGKKALKEFGISPPPGHNMVIDLEILENVLCPHCDSHDTTTRSVFGSTLCRSSHFCNNCNQFFEQFKPI